MTDVQWIQCNSRDEAARVGLTTFLRAHLPVRPAGTRVRLTAKERILIHLSDYAKYSDAVEVPAEMGQGPIAQAAGIYLQHVRQFLDPLLKEGLVRERTAHVKGHRRRLKVYNLTESGRFAAARLREQVRTEEVRVRDAEGERLTTVGEILRESPGSIPLSIIVREMGEGRVIDLTSLGGGPKKGFFARLSEAPRLEAFVGREAELEILTREQGGPRICVIRGVAGIGKSSLAAKACERLRSSRNVYWHRIRPWDTRLSILAGLGDFLAAIGRPGLRAVLERGEGGRADEVLREDLNGAGSILVFDDVHEAIPEVVELLRFLKDAIADAPDARALVLTRRSVPFYDRRDVVIRKLIKEIDLEGLGRDEIAALLPTDSAGRRLVTIARKLGGHPLFVELLRSSAPRDVGTASLTDIRRFIEEEIYSELSDSERRMMKMAALYAVPFPREAIFADPGLSHDVFLSLLTKSLIRPVEADAFEVHDTIRDFFTSVLTPSEREALAPLAVNWLVALSKTATDAGDFTIALNDLSNALGLATSKEARAALSENLGDTYEKLGDFPAFLATFTEALREEVNPESIARLHRKTASALLVRGEPASGEIEAAFRALGELPSMERGWLHLLRSRVASTQEEWREAREEGEAALTAFTASGDAEGQTLAWLALGSMEIYAPQGNPSEAVRCLLSALDLSKAEHRPDEEARAHVSLVNVYAYRIGDVKEATRHIEAIRSLEPSITNPFVLRSTLMFRGWFALYQQRDYEAAESFFAQAASLSRKIHDRAGIAYANGGQAQTLFFRGEIGAAREGLRKFAAEVPEFGSSGEEVEALWSVAEASLVLGDSAGFLEVAAKVREARLAEGVAARPLHARVLEGLDAFLRGDSDSCCTAFEAALDVAETSYQAGEAWPLGVVHFYYGVALQGMGRDAEGSEHVRQAREVLLRGGILAQLDAIARDESALVDYLRRGFLAARLGRS